MFSAGTSSGELDRPVYSGRGRQGTDPKLPPVSEKLIVLLSELGLLAAIRFKHGDRHQDETVFFLISFIITPGEPVDRLQCQFLNCNIKSCVVAMLNMN